MTDEERSRLQKRLRRIAGQVGGLQKMVDENQYCVDILTQLSAVRSALDALGVELLANHLQHCVAAHADGSDAHPHAAHKSREELLREVRTLLDRFLS
jgi:DNA-binding FrmR family transcriptional regulator